MTLVVASNVQCAFSVSFTCISSCSRVFRPQVWWWVGANSNIYPGVKYTQQSGRVLGAVIGAVMHTFMSRCCSHTCPALRAQRVFSVVQLLGHFTSILLGKYTCSQRSVKVGNVQSNTWAWFIQSGCKRGVQWSGKEIDVLC